MATVRKLKFQDRLFYIILYFLLGVFCFSTLYPFIYFLVLSLNDGKTHCVAESTCGGGNSRWKIT